MSMADIIVKITIPEREYKQWYEFETDGIEGVKEILKSDIRHRLKQDHVKEFDIEIEETN